MEYNEDVFSPQPMLAQTRTVLKKYADAGGSCAEIVVPEAGHVPFIEKPKEFNAFFHTHKRPCLNTQVGG